MAVFADSFTGLQEARIRENEANERAASQAGARFLQAYGLLSEQKNKENALRQRAVENSIANKEYEDYLDIMRNRANAPTAADVAGLRKVYTQASVTGMFDDKAYADAIRSGIAPQEADAWRVQSDAIRKTLDERNTLATDWADKLNSFSTKRRLWESWANETEQALKDLPQARSLAGTWTPFGFTDSGSAKMLSSRASGLRNAIGQLPAQEMDLRKQAGDLVDYNPLTGTYSSAVERPWAPKPAATPPRTGTERAPMTGARPAPTINPLAPGGPLSAPGGTTLPPGMRITPGAPAAFGGGTTTAVQPPARGVRMYHPEDQTGKIWIIAPENVERALTRGLLVAP